MQSPSQKRRWTIEDEASGIRMPVDRAVGRAFRLCREGHRSCRACAMQTGRGTDVRSDGRHDLDKPVALRGDACRSQLACRQRVPRRAAQIRPTVITSERRRFSCVCSVCVQSWWRLRKKPRRLRRGFYFEGARRCGDTSHFVIASDPPSFAGRTTARVGGSEAIQF